MHSYVNFLVLGQWGFHILQRKLSYYALNTFIWVLFFKIFHTVGYIWIHTNEPFPWYLNIVKSELYIYNFNICIRNRFFVRYLFVGTELELIYLRWQITYLSDPTQYKKWFRLCHINFFAPSEGMQKGISIDGVNYEVM